MEGISAEKVVNIKKEVIEGDRVLRILNKDEKKEGEKNKKNENEQKG